MRQKTIFENRFFSFFAPIIVFFIFCPVLFKIRGNGLNPTEQLPSFGVQTVTYACSAEDQLERNPKYLLAQRTPNLDETNTDNGSELTATSTSPASHEIKLALPSSTTRFEGLKKFHFIDSFHIGMAKNYENHFYPIKNRVSEVDDTELLKSLNALRERFSSLSHQDYASIVQLGGDYLDVLNNSPRVKTRLTQHDYTKLEITDLGRVGAPRDPNASGFSAVNRGVGIPLTRNQFRKDFKNALDVKKEQQRMDGIQLLMRTVQNYQVGSQSFPEVLHELESTLDQFRINQREHSSLQGIRSDTSLSPRGVIFSKPTPLGPKGVFSYNFMTNDFLVGIGSDKIYPLSKGNPKVGVSCGWCCGPKFHYTRLERTFSHTGYGLHGFVGFGVGF